MWSVCSVSSETKGSAMETAIGVSVSKKKLKKFLIGV